MFTVIVQSLNQYGEIELEQSFRTKTKAAAAMLAGKWCSAGWGSEWKDVTSKRQLSVNMILWQINWK